MKPRGKHVQMGTVSFVDGILRPLGPLVRAVLGSANENAWAVKQAWGLITGINRNTVHHQIEDSTSMHLGYRGESVWGVCARWGVPNGLLDGLLERLDWAVEESVSLPPEPEGLCAERGETPTVKGGVWDSGRGGSLCAGFAV